MAINFVMLFLTLKINQRFVKPNLFFIYLYEQENDWNNEKNKNLVHFYAFLPVVRCILTTIRLL